MLLFWLLLFGFILLDWGKLFGIPYLFLDPEYHGKVDGRSLFILGLGFGIFNTSFQITCYILDSERFRFLAGVRNAIFKFALNNSILPAFFLIAFATRFWLFQVDRGLESGGEAFRELLAFLGGFLWIQILTFGYFKLASSKPMRQLSAATDHRLRSISFYRLAIWKRLRTFRQNRFKVGHYFSTGFFMQEARSGLPTARILKAEAMFTTNHLAAVLLEVATILVLFVMGLFSGSAVFQIPAGASIFLFFGFILMAIGALSYWLRGWSISIFIGFAIFINLLFSAGILNRSYQVFGIDYSHLEQYNTRKINSMADSERFSSDSVNTIGILNRWKEKTNQAKPKMVLVCTSGGGIRSATWTMRTLQYADSLLGSGLMKQTTLITGASGGLLGAAYFRELYLQNFVAHNVDYYERKYIDNISKDILNPVVFSLITNDIMIRLKRYSDRKYIYNADRGLVFEQTLNQNLGNALNKSLYHYKNAEMQAIIPMMLISPVVVNDGRKLYISPIPVSYMTWDKGNRNSTPSFQLVKGVEWNRFFDSCDAMRLNFTSALRMNATFPYITPNVSLPTTPTIEVMDGGLSDNFGVSDALRFLHVFKAWVETETSGAVLLCIRDTPKERKFRKQNHDSWFSRIINPVGSVYANWARNQDYNNDMQEEYLTQSMEVPLDVVTFQYLAPGDLDEGPTEEQKSEERASLSWHLTTFETRSIESSILHPKNQEAMHKLRELLRFSDR